MKQFVVTRSRSKGLKSIEVFEESEHLEAGVAAELAELEGHEAQVFLGDNLVDVARTGPEWFAVEGAAHA